MANKILQQLQLENTARVSAGIGILMGILALMDWTPFKKELLLAPGYFIFGLINAVVAIPSGIFPQLIGVLANGAFFGVAGFALMWLWQNINMPQTYKGIAVLIMVGLLVPVIATNVKDYHTPFSTTLAVTEQKICQAMKPVFGSINCEIDPVPKETAVLPGNVFSCTTDDHECLFLGMDNNDKEPTCTGLVCGGWGAKLTDVTPNSGSTGNIVWSCPIFDVWDWSTASTSCMRKNLPLPLRTGHQYKWEFYSGFGSVKNIQDYNANFEKKVEYFSVYMDGGHVPLSQTTGCRDNLMVDGTWNNQFEGKQVALGLIPTITSAAKDGLQYFGGGQPDTSKTTAESLPIDSQPPQGYWIITDWKRIEAPGLVLSKYQGKDVWCNPSSREIFEVKNINVNNGECYSLPASRMGTVECCESTWCQINKGQSYTCDSIATADHTPTFTCVKQAQCRTDYDCMANAQQCGMTQNNKFQLTKNSCVDGTCQTTTQAVQCCDGKGDGGPTICPAGQYCDYQKGCQYLQGTPCPAGACCMGPKYQQQSCDGKTQECCWSETDVFLGWCKDKGTCPSTKCASSDDCKDTYQCTQGACVPLRCETGLEIQDHKCVKPQLQLIWILVFTLIGVILGAYAIQNSGINKGQRPIFLFGFAAVGAMIPVVLGMLGYPLPNIGGDLFACQAAETQACKGVTDLLCQINSALGPMFAPLIYGVVMIGAILGFISTFDLTKGLFNALDEDTRYIVQWASSLLVAIIAAKLVCALFWMTAVVLFLYYIIVRVLFPTVSKGALAYATGGLSRLAKGGKK